MVFFISRLKLRNFKSFKAADIELPPTYVCFAGPNGSGKSNLCDAIRFVMGEKSLKSLRAKKVKDLIHAGAKAAGVTLAFKGDDGTEYEIKRAIREDGKIHYRLNGEKTTRNAVLETLKKHNLDESGRNTIAQGEVQHIINMNGKERRLIIDSVAGIADFEEKKKEAIRELTTVEERIKDGKLVLGERKAYLSELEQEKEVAIKYKDAKKSFNDAKGTLLKIEIDRLEKELDESLGGEKELTSKKEKDEHEIVKVEQEIKKIDEIRAKTSEELQSKQKTSAMIRRLEELKASSGSNNQLIVDKQASIGSADNEIKSIKNAINEENIAIKNIDDGLAELRSQLKEADANLTAHGGAIEDEKVTKIRETIARYEKELSNTREKLILLNSEIIAKKDIIKAKDEELKSTTPDGDDDEEEYDIEKLQNEVERIVREIERSFSKTKEINVEISELDREMLGLKEKASIFKVRSSPQLANPALSFINDLMKKDGSGIHGTLANLISFDARYANAVEAAAGSRLLYIVVDNVDTATSVIEKLKRAKCGRATFIPLDTVRVAQGIAKNGFTSIVDVIDFQEKIRRAVHYVFADTLLVKTITDAKGVGIGNARMVTMDGEIFERSGIISGGRSQSGILSANQLKKIENELDEVKARKEGLIQELYSIREEESVLRAKKSQVEIQIKTIEMKQKHSKEKENTFKRRKQLEIEIDQLEKAVNERIVEKEQLQNSLLGIESEIIKIREQLTFAEEEFKQNSEESSRKRAELSGRVSSLRATIEGKPSEIELRKKENKSNEDRMNKLIVDRKDSLQRIDEIKKQLDNDQKELTSLEEKISSASKAIEKLFEKMKENENQLQQLGEIRGRIRIDLDKTNKELNQLNVKKASVTTRLEDIKAEFGSHQEFEFLDMKKEELSRIIKESESTLNGLGNVNMAAIDMYDKKKAEIDDVEERIEKLDKEREAILGMIDEIDEHKKEAFFETFNAVAENFSNMFKHVNIGQGHLYLNNPSDPFESGLFIKLRRENHDHALDALSGGEKTLVAVIFIFALQFFKPAPFYILDEVDAALDKANSKNLADLVSRTSKDSQFIIVSHNDTVMANSDSVIGVTKVGTVSKLVGIKIKQVAST